MLTSLDAKVFVLALLNALLLTGGVVFQKLNGVNQGNVVISGWLTLALICFAPTFFLGNQALLIGGRVSVFNTSTAAMHFVLITVIGHYVFREPLGLEQIAGVGFIMVGLGFLMRA